MDLSKLYSQLKRRKKSGIEREIDATRKERDQVTRKLCKTFESTMNFFADVYPDYAKGMMAIYRKSKKNEKLVVVGQFYRDLMTWQRLYGRKS